jgi:hypothetical protein
VFTQTCKNRSGHVLQRSQCCARHPSEAQLQRRAAQSISPLAIWLGGHISPELRYLEAQFAALLPYGVSARMLGTVLPLERATSITTWKRHVASIGVRLDREAHERVASAMEA